MNFKIGKWFVETVTGVADKFIPTAKARLAFKEKLMEVSYQLTDKYYEVIVALQKQSSGSKIVDGMKHLVRPIIALVMIYEQVAWNHGWLVNEPNQWITNGIIAFYFASRGFEKITGKS